MILTGRRPFRLWRTLARQARSTVQSVEARKIDQLWSVVASCSSAFIAEKCRYAFETTDNDAGFDESASVATRDLDIWTRHLLERIDGEPFVLAFYCGNDAPVIFYVVVNQLVKPEFAQKMDALIAHADREVRSLLASSADCISKG